MIELHGEESNYHVLEEVLKHIKAGKDAAKLVPILDEFLAPKRVIATEMDELTYRARRGAAKATNAARELIVKFAEMKDGKNENE